MAAYLHYAAILAVQNMTSHYRLMSYVDPSTSLCARQPLFILNLSIIEPPSSFASTDVLLLSRPELLDLASGKSRTAHLPLQTFVLLFQPCLTPLTIVKSLVVSYPLPQPYCSHSRLVRGRAGQSFKTLQFISGQFMICTRITRRSSMQSMLFCFFPGLGPVTYVIVQMMPFVPCLGCQEAITKSLRPHRPGEIYNTVFSLHPCV